MQIVKTGEHFCFCALGQECHSDILGLRCLSGVGSCILKLSGEVILQTSLKPQEVRSG